jgi:hypothetical protein
LNFVTYPYDARHALAAIDAKLPLMKGTHATPQSDNSLSGLDFNAAPSRKMLLRQEIDHTTLQFVVSLVKHEWASYHNCTERG